MEGWDGASLVTVLGRVGPVLDAGSQRVGAQVISEDGPKGLGQSQSGQLYTLDGVRNLVLPACQLRALKVGNVDRWVCRHVCRSVANGNRGDEH